MGLSYSEIAEALKKQYYVGPSKGQLSDWLRGIHGPFGSANRSVANPTPELAYVIGVRLGDGSLNRKGYNRRIRLSSVDLDFILEFDRSLSCVLGTKRHTPRFDPKRGDFSIEASSVLLYDFLNQAWTDLRPWIDHCPSCVSMFLRGFFDSEGCVTTEGDVTCSNSKFALLKFIQHLLFSYFKIETTGPHLCTKAGTELWRRGRKYIRRLDVYYIRVRAASHVDFGRSVGFAIRRKMARLDDKISLLPG